MFIRFVCFCSLAFSLSACGRKEEVTSSASIFDNNQETNLSCTCYGGPGMYPYACQKIAKTCYGGPGMYPYTCYECP